MFIFENLDLFSVAVAIAGTFSLGFTVYFNNQKSVTHRSFLAFTIISGLWGLANFFGYKNTDPDVALWLLRVVLFLAVWQAFSIFRLFSVFPLDKVVFPKYHKFIILPTVIITSLVVMTPYVFESVSKLSDSGQIIEIKNGPAIILFGIVSVSLVLSALYVFIKNLLSNQKGERRVYVEILLGTAIMFGLIITFNFIYPAILDNAQYLPLGALFIFPFVLLASHAILKYKLFNIKAAGTSLLVFFLTVVTFIEITITSDLITILYRSAVFFLVLLFGILLIRGVFQEVKQREQIQELANNLETANKEQQSLIHFITHQVKGFFTISRNVFAGMLEGDYGELTEASKKVAQRGFDSDTKAVQTVQEILKASNLKKGTIEYKKEKVNLTQIVKDQVEKVKSRIEEKGLKLTLNIDTEPVEMIGDFMQLEHAVTNLIDNSIKYTPKGSIFVSLQKDDKAIRFIVKDTGVGINSEDMKRMFTEGGRGANAVKVNVQSTGYGLYIVKKIIEAHKGKVWVESGGTGKGSRFIIEFPVESNKV